MATKFSKLTLLILITLTAPACVPGAIYTDIITPLTLNMDNTPVGEALGRSASKQVSDPVSGVKVSWSSTAIGDAMKTAKLGHANFADIRTQSVLLGVWQRQTVIVNGDKVSPAGVEATKSE